MRRLRLLVPLLLGLVSPLCAAVSPEAAALRDRGLAELENERPAEAETTFRALLPLAPDDPLPQANLAIALLRQQKSAEALAAIDAALAMAPERGELLAVRGDILQWTGDREAALDLYRRAAELRPDDVEIWYSLYRLAATLQGAAAEAALDRSLEALARLRPENAVVLLHRGQRSIQRGDRSTATAAYLRIRELLWQVPAVAQTALDGVLAALEGGDPAAARVPAMRLENVLKVSAMYQQGLRELNIGIQGLPLERFATEPLPGSFGKPLEISFSGRRLDASSVSGRALAAGDFDGDQRADAVWVVSAPEPALRVLLSSGTARPPLPAPTGIVGLLAADLDNDGRLDLVGYGPEVTVLWRGTAEGFAVATPELGLAEARGSAAAVLDFDIEGDLDLVTAGGRPESWELYRNNLAGALEPVGAHALPASAPRGVADLVASDLDRDGDQDLLAARGQGLTWLDNLRQGRFADRSTAAGLGASVEARAVASGDLDNDGWPDLISAGRGLSFFHNLGGRFEPWELGGALLTTAALDDVVAFDADNDGRLDLAVAGEHAVAVITQREGGGLGFADVAAAPEAARTLAPVDWDGDGDLDLLAAGGDGVHLLENRGGNRNRWLAIRLRGLDKGNSKNNLFGLGATLEARSGAAYQFREVSGDVTHLGLGASRAADLLRVVWTNGVPQNRMQVAAEQTIVEEQLLKGSCPFLYTWTGERMEFVTDLLWGAPLGLPLAPGVWMPADPSELVRVDRARTVEGRYELRVTEELWEAAFFDHVRLWVVDHPDDIEVASSLRIQPGEEIGERVLGTRAVRPLAAALDARGADVTARVAARDEVYADGWSAGPYQGLAAETWIFELDLGESPGGPIRLLLDGWIFPTDASLNLALAQRPTGGPTPPRLEVETVQGWQTLLPSMGFPAGKTKTMVVDTPPLPAGARRLRIVSSQWLSWDRIVWSTAPADDEPRVLARLLPATAALRFRGFSEIERAAPNAPHHFDYERVRTTSPWLPFAGRYTRYGEVGDLLQTADDLSVILAPGDEIALSFDASALPSPAPGWRRTVFLESHGWDKDADRNTGAGERLEPLPFRAMSRYPPPPGESFPDDTAHRLYRQEWLTRELGTLPPGPSSLDAGASPPRR